MSNQEGLNLALEKMKTNLPWKEYLDISVDLGEIPDAQDDIKRELALQVFELVYQFVVMKPLLKLQWKDENY